MSTQPTTNSRPATPVEEQSHFLCLPDELILRIFMYLAEAHDNRALANCRLICKRCKKIAADSQIWNLMLHGIFPGGTPLQNPGLFYYSKPHLLDLSITIPDSDPPLLCTMAWSPDETFLAIASEEDDTEYRIRFLDTDSWALDSQRHRVRLQGHTDEVECLAFSPTGAILASGSRDYTIKFWNTQDSSCTATLTEHANRVCSIAFSPDGVILASGSRDQTIKLWDTQDHSCVATLTGHTLSVRCVAFSPNGAILASGSGDQSIKLWNTQDHSCRATLIGHIGIVMSIAFFPNRAMLASGSEDTTIKLWNIQDHSCTATLRGHTDRVYSVAFSPNGGVLASGSSDMTIKIWDPYAHNCIATYRGHRWSVKCVAFSPSGALLASLSLDRSVKIWGMPNEKLKALIAQENQEANPGTVPTDSSPTTE